MPSGPWGAPYQSSRLPPSRLGDRVEEIVAAGDTAQVLGRATVLAAQKPQVEHARLGLLDSLHNDTVPPALAEIVGIAELLKELEAENAKLKELRPGHDRPLELLMGSTAGYGLHRVPFPMCYGPTGDDQQGAGRVGLSQRRPSQLHRARQAGPNRHCRELQRPVPR